MLCGLNPVADRDMLLKQVEVMLISPHSVELDAMTPEEIADYARVHAITVCDEKMRRNPKVFDMLQSYRVDDVDWVCMGRMEHHLQSDKNIPACMGREVRQPGYTLWARKTQLKSRIVGFCQLAMKDHSSVNEIRHCVDQAMAIQPAQSKLQCPVGLEPHTIHIHLATKQVEKLLLVSEIMCRDETRMETLLLRMSQPIILRRH